MIQISTGQHIDQVHINIDAIERILEQIELATDFRIFVDTLEYFNGVREEVEEEYSVLIVNIDRDQFNNSEDKYGLFVHKLLRGLRWTELVDGAAIADHLEKSLRKGV